MQEASFPLIFGGNPPALYLQKRFTVRSYECGQSFRLTPATLLNYLQEIAGLHANQIGVGIATLRTSGLTWVLVRMHLLIHAPLPSWGEDIIVTTWPSGVRGSLAAYRDFSIASDDGSLLAEAVSEWLILDTIKLRPARLTPEVLALAPTGTPRVSIPTRVQSHSKERLIDSVTFPVRRADLDQNQHVNNVHYSEWALESAPSNTPMTYLKELCITFKESARLGDTIKSTTFELTSGTFHHIVSDETNPKRIFADLFTVWNQ